MKIYQGTPLSGMITKKDGSEQWVSDLSGESYEAVLRHPLYGIVKSWSSAKGTITFGSMTQSGSTIGYATFVMTGTETAQLDAGNYTMEISKVLTDGRAIAVESDAVLVQPAELRRGV